MRYILNDSGYIETISFTHEVGCNNKTCTEYTGSVPTGYESLAEWSDNANINAYKIVDGNLTYDSEEDARLQNLWTSQEASNKNETVLYENSSGTTGTVTLNETSANFTYLEIFYFDNLGLDIQSVRFFNPNNRTVTLSCLEPSDAPGINFRVSRYKVAENTITYKKATYGGIYHQAYPYSEATPYVKIVKVVGYR